MRLRKPESVWLVTSICVLAAAGAVTRVLLAAASMSSPANGTLTLTPCHVDFLPEEVLCGVHQVFENRQQGTGKQISIHVAVLPPLRRSAQPDPLFIFSGGPGQGARSFAPVAARYFRQMRRMRAVVLVDLRGTGASGALKCPGSGDEISKLANGADLYLGNGIDCLAAIHEDVRQYTHANALADLDEIRRRLGYSRINVWGGSWGTRAAVLYALMYPDAVRSVVLDGAVALDLGFPAPVARNAQQAFDRLGERCASEPNCAIAFPNPRVELDAVLEGLDRPRVVTLRHPRTGIPVTVTLSRDAVAELVRVALYATTDAARLLQTLRHAALGDFGPLAAQYAHSARMSTDDMALGFTLSVLCSEDVPQSAAAALPDDESSTFLGHGYSDGWRRRCRGWPLGAPIDIDRTAVSGAPALILSGLHDPVTPPSAGEAMARHFANATHIVVPGAAHNASFTGCATRLIATFLEHGRLDETEAECVTRVPLPPIVLNDAGGQR